LESGGRRRTAVVASLAFAAGLVLGFLLAGIRDIPLATPGPGPAPGPATEVAPEPAPARTGSTAPPLSSAPAAQVPAVPPRAEGDAGDGETPLVAAWFEVKVTSEEGIRPSGTVYALPAGSPGAETGAVPSAALPNEGAARLPVVNEGLYDVGFVSESWGTALATDVRIAAGETRSVALTLAARKPITIRCAAPLPGDDGHTRPGVSVFSEIEGTAWSLPGRGSPCRLRLLNCELNSEGAAATPPLPTDRDYTIRVQSDDGRAGFESFHAGFLLDPDPPRARAGDTVTLRVREAVEVTLRPAPADRWPRRPTWMCVFLKQDLRTRGTHGMGAGCDEEGAIRSVVVPALAGPAVVEWSGDGVAPGRLEVKVRAGSAQTIDLPVAFDPAGKRDCAAESAEFGDIALVVTGIPAGRPSRALFRVAALAGGEGTFARRTGDLSALLDPAEVRVIDERWLESRTLAGFLGIDLASEPFATPRQGPLTVALKPAGLLAVIPEEVFPEELGELRLRRKDGLAFPMVDLGEGVVTGVQESLTVFPGLLVGPLPEGTVTFEASLGEVRLPDVTVEVKAGKTRPLLIKR
jgi:hypothetical protein